MEINKKVKMNKFFMVHFSRSIHDIVAVIIEPCVQPKKSTRQVMTMSAVDDHVESSSLDLFFSSPTCAHVWISPE